MFVLNDFVEKFGGETLSVKYIPGVGLSLQLLGIVALTNYKALSRLGTFDAITKTTTLTVFTAADFNKEVMTFRVNGVREDEPVMVVKGRPGLVVLVEDFDERDIWVNADYGTVSKLCKRLNGSKAKKFATVKEAFASRRAAGARAAARREPTDIYNHSVYPDWMGDPDWRVDDQGVGKWLDLDYQA